MERTESLTAASAPARGIGGSCIDWAAVLGGMVVAAAAATLFTVFGTALGLSTVSAEPGEGSVTLLLVVTAIWTVASLAVAYLAGGYVAGRMRRRVEDAGAEEVSTRDGINGLVVWGLGMLLTAWMAAGAVGTAAVTAGNAVGSAAGGVAGGVAQATGAALGGAAEAVGAAASGDGDAIDWIAGSLMRGPPAAPAADAGPASPAEIGAIGSQSAAILANLLRTGEISGEDTAYLVAATARATGLPPGEAQARVDRAIAATQETRAEAGRLAEEAEATAREAAETARISAILTAFLLAAASLVAGAAAVAGAVRGGRHRDEGRVFGGLTYRI